MKKATLIALIFTGSCLSTPSRAQAFSDSLETVGRFFKPYNEYTLGVGERVDASRLREISLSAKYFFSSKTALQLTLGKYEDSAISSLLIARHHFILHSRKLRFSYGAGVTGHLFRKADGVYHNGDRFKRYATFQVGFEYNLHQLPLSIGTDARIHYSYREGKFTNVPYGTIGVSIHYTFGKK